jgi:hypothetical protein
MNIKVLISILLIFLCSLKMSAQSTNDFYQIENVRYSEEISFPFIISKLPENVEIANRINKRLQNILFDEGKIINNSNLQSIKEYLYIQNDTINQSGISSLNYTIDFYSRFIKITINIDWAGGPYPVGAETDYLHFDLKKGELVLMPDLIDGAKYFDFLDKFWLNDCRNSIRAAHQCAYGNETDNYESDSAYTLDGECEFQCHKMNHQFILTNDTIFISNNSHCFPHVWQNCNFGSSQYLKITDIKDFLSDYGKWLLGFNNSYKDVKPYFHFVGKINDKYKISMSLCKSMNDLVEGEYFYWKQNKKILLKGQIQSDSEQIIIDELVNNSKTGSFELEWDDFLYSTDGFWYNSSKEKKLSVKLFNVYDYSKRDYNR